MSSKPVQVQLPNGEVIWVRVALDGPQNVASGALQHLDMEQLSKTVQGVSESLRQAVSDMVPDEVQVEFGLELALKSGKIISVLAEAGATASVKITLAWKGDAAAVASLEPGVDAAG